MKRTILNIFLLCILVLTGCDDNTGSIGGTLMPPSDVMKSGTAFYEVTTESVKADSVYARSSTGYIGRYTDPNFGYYEASFLTELNCLDNYRFPDIYSYDESTGKASGILVDDSVRRLELVIYYSTWFGDSLNACRMSAYRLNDNWIAQRNIKDRSYRYTNINVEDYYDETGLLGSKAYTAYDKTVPESDLYGTDSNGYSLYYPHITFPLTQEEGQRIFDLNRTHPEYFKNSEEFIKNVFSGVYLKSDLGDGTILYVDRVDLQMTLLTHYLDKDGIALKKKVTDDKGVEGADSVGLSTQVVFASTKEVIQANRFENSSKIDMRVAETGNTYIKSPAGIFTSINIPYDRIAEELKNDTINSVNLVITNYDQESEYDFSMSTPSTVLLIRQKDMKDFFENSKVADSELTYVVTHNASSNNTYTFNNIARLVTTTIKEKEQAKATAGTWTSEMEESWQEDNRLLLIPVTATYDYDVYGSSYMITLEHSLAPTYAKLIGGAEHPISIEVTYTTFGQ